VNTYSLRPAAAIVIAGAAIALLVAVPSPAAAHDGLVSSSPAAGSTATSEIETVSLTFSDELLDIGDSNGAFAIQVVGQDDLYYNLDCVQRDGPTASTAVALGESGTYEVRWQVASSDAHITSDTFDFVYEKPTGAVAAPGTTSAPCGTGSEDDSTAEEGASGDADESRTVTGLWVFGGGLVAFLVASAILVAVLGARSQRRREVSRGKQPE
tara:strand:- start:8145 stop:8780 length:636 start_codon:yes stop_codon:yes gene_type:complete